MARNEINGQVVVLDGAEFRDTNFVGCTLIYGGGALPTLVSNDFNGCEWVFNGAAANTLSFMKALIAAGPSTRDFVLQFMLGLQIVQEGPGHGARLN